MYGKGMKKRKIAKTKTKPEKEMIEARKRVEIGLEEIDVRGVN